MTRLEVIFLGVCSYEYSGTSRIDETLNREKEAEGTRG